MSKAIVAIVGRQNVGKSTLLNRMVGKQLAIVENIPGTTRDRIIADVTWQSKTFTVVDTGGLEPEPDPNSTIAQGVKEQVATAITEADVIVLITDVKNGVMASDEEISDILRRESKPVILVSNKADNPKLEGDAVDFYRLGLGEPVIISAQHSRGINILLDKIVEHLPESVAETTTDALKIAIVGRPNVGKSMLLNALAGNKRAIVDDTPGTTRDANDTMVEYENEPVLLIDTAGVRRRGKIESGIEKYSVIRTTRAIERSDVALLIMDATEPVTAQDLHVASYIQQDAKGVILVINKWDLVTDKNLREWETFVRSQIKFMSYAPILYISAKYGDGIEKIMPLARRIQRERTKRLKTSVVNEVVQEAVAAHISPRLGSKRLKVLYATQAEANPPTFVFFVNDTNLVHFSYRRFLENRLRKAFDFTGTPLRMTFKARRNS